MKRIVLFLWVMAAAITGHAQLLSWTPAFPVQTSTISITMDPTKGNRGLNGYTPVTDVYVHIGVITNLSTSITNWRYVKFNQNFNTPNALLQASYNAGTNRWTFNITQNLRTYFGITNPSENIEKIAILFRNGAGTSVQRNADGSDMYIPIYPVGLATRLSVPLKQPTFIPQPEPISLAVGNAIPFTGISNDLADLRLYYNGSLVQTALNASTVSASPTINVAGTQTLVVEANDGSEIKKDTIKFFVPGANNIQSLPAGVRDGINYEANNTAATFVLFAPNKNRVTIIGDLPGSNWTEQLQYQMNKTPDGNYYWLRVTGLTPGTEYSFQYLVDGSIRIADPYCEKILDPWNDSFIPSAVYPNLKPYPTGLTNGIVGIVQTASPAYNWQTTNYTRPDKRNLMIYELLHRDFLATPNWTTLRDTLTYLKRLGITAIKLMPFNEFEGNISWGYNPDFYFAPDKYYGTKNNLKQFIDICHANGIAVIMDIALNHSFGLSPMVQLYWDAANNRPAANNPWYNPVARHAFNVGFDFNHESLSTRYFFSRVVEHWLQEYKIDGFRFDLSKGFTQNNTCDVNGANCNVGAWSGYDQSRVNIWNRYYDTLQLKSPGSYAILEHFADNSEENVLQSRGFMFWGNLNTSFSQAAMGYTTDWDFKWGIHTERGWSNPHLITYAESHDEERVMYKMLQFGNSNPGVYNTKILDTALQRMELISAFMLTIPGPKMIWQFGELGYDFSINYCQNGTVNSNCRTDPKPVRWDYYNVPDRRKLYDVNRVLMQLRKNPLYSPLFVSNSVQYNLSGFVKWMKISQGITGIVVIGNFDVATQTGSVSFPFGGTWYNYMNPGQTFNATGGSQSFTLAPGEYRVYLSSFVVVPVDLLSFTGQHNGNSNLLKWTVANEQNLEYYELQRSLNGVDFVSVGDVTATGSSSYGYNDPVANVPSPVYYYRLRMVDRDGNFKLSEIVKINAGRAAWFAEANPNPFGSRLNIRIQSPQQTNARILVTDMSGRQVLQRQVTLINGVNMVNIAEADVLESGVYNVTIITASDRYSIRAVKVK